MTRRATHNVHDNTPERVLFVAFGLNEKNWKLGFTTGMVKSRASAVSQRATRRACCKKWYRPKSALAYPTPRWC
jgi:hypothetical protein